MNFLAFLASRGGSAVFTLLGWKICSLLAPSGAWNLTTIETRQGREVPPLFKPPALTLDSTCEEMLQWLPPRMQSHLPVVVQVVNEPYLRIQRNFILLMKKNSTMTPTNLYLLCVGKETVRTLNGMEDVRCVEVDGMKPNDSTQSGRYRLFELRTKVLRCLVVEAGLDVLMSDNDALWVKDPLPDLLSTKGDLLVQRAHWPADLVEPVYGVTMCAGFAFYRAGGEGMPRLLNAMLRETINHRDDQIGLIQAAHQLHLEWNYDKSKSDMRQAQSTDLGFGVIADLPGNFTVVLLPQSKYTRSKFKVSKETIVAHVFDCSYREQRMKHFNLWLVD